MKNNLRLFKQNYLIYLEATGKNLDTTAKKAAILLNLIGEEGTIELLNTSNLNEDDQKNHKKIIEAFEKYLEPRKNIIYNNLFIL